MSAPRVRVVLEIDIYIWTCRTDGWCSSGFADSIAAASDAGRAHLAAHHTAQMPPATYCRTHGTRSDDCRCQVALGDTEDAGGPENGLGRCEYCWHPVSEHYGRWCRHATGAIKASGAKRICCCEGADSESSGGLQITNNPIQRTYDTSREDC